MKKILYFLAAMTLAACSEFEPDHSALSNKEICFKVCTSDQSAENGSRAVTDSISGFQEPIKAESDYDKPMYMYPLVSKTADVVDELKSSSRVTLYTENNLSNFGVVAFRRASSASIASMAPNFIYDAEVVKTGNRWATTEKQFWPMNNDVLDFYAYAPYQGAGITLSSASATGVPTITYDASSQHDLITATATNQALTVTGTGVPLTFNHALTTIKFEKSDELPGTITSINIKKVYNSGKLTFGGSWSFAGITRSDVAATEGVAMTMIPQQFSDSEQLIEVVYNEGERTYTFSYPLTGSSWVAGSTITYVIMSSTIKLNIGSIVFPSLKTNLPKQNYSNGDEAGLYVADASGNLIHSNVKITYNGSKWTIPSSINLYYEAGYSFFAYYPYKTEGLTPTTNITSAPTFFATGISSWTILSNQSTSTSFVSSDLQVAKGTISLDARAINFTMNHAVGLAYINLGTKSVNVYSIFRLSKDANYRWNSSTSSQNVKASSSFSGNTPYPITSGTNYVAVVKASTATSFSATGTDSWSQSCNVAANSSYTYTVQSSRTSIDNYTSYTLQVGDYLYSDGSFAHSSSMPTATAARHPIAVVFSTTTSTTDTNAGYKSGYAIALASAGAQLRWCKAGIGAASTSVNSAVTTLAAAKADLDGRRKTNVVVSRSDFSKANYPSFYYATHFGTSEIGLTTGTGSSSSEASGGSAGYAAPTGSTVKNSGWYLGSIGQYYLVAKNLGGNIDNPSSTWNEGGSKYWYVSGVSQANKNALEAIFAKGSSSWAPSFGIPWSSSNQYSWYWTSSEFSASNGFRVYWHRGGNFGLSGDSAKSYPDADNRGVRPVIAF